MNIRLSRLILVIGAFCFIIGAYLAVHGLFKAVVITPRYSESMPANMDVITPLLDIRPKIAVTIAIEADVESDKFKKSGDGKEWPVYEIPLAIEVLDSSGKILRQEMTAITSENGESRLESMARKPGFWEVHATFVPVQASASAEGGVRFHLAISPDIKYGSRIKNARILILDNYESVSVAGILSGITLLLLGCFLSVGVALLWLIRRIKNREPAKVGYIAKK